MRYLFIALLFLSGCNMKTYEQREAEEINEDKTRLIDQIIAADKHKSTYEVLAMYKYRWALVDVVNKVALRDGWETVGGMVAENRSGSTYSDNTYMQTIKKVDKTLSVYRLENGNLALSHTAEVK
jgi:hypothetical protein